MVQTDFPWQEYTEYFPDDPERRKYLMEIFTTHGFGFKRRLRLLQEIQRLNTRHAERVNRVKAQLDRMSESLLKNRYGRARKTQNTLSPTEHLRAFLNSITDEAQLREWCTRCDVDYDSFMRTNDKDGLIEAIIDESTKVETVNN